MSEPAAKKPRKASAARQRGDHDDDDVKPDTSSSATISSSSVARNNSGQFKSSDNNDDNVKPTPATINSGGRVDDVQSSSASGIISSDTDVKPDASAAISSSFASARGHVQSSSTSGIITSGTDDVKPDVSATISSSFASARGHVQSSSAGTYSDNDDVKPDPSTISSSSRVHGFEKNPNSKELTRIFKTDPDDDDDNDDVYDDDDAKPAAKHKEDDDNDDDNVKSTTTTATTKNRVLVEFKFRSYKTQLFKEGGMQGTLHVAMDQDPHSGIYSIPAGETPFTVHLNNEIKNSESWCLRKQKDVESPCLEFTGKFTPNSVNGPMDMDPGLVLDFFTGNHRDFKTTVRPPSVAKNYPPYNEIKAAGSVPFTTSGLSKWEKEQGGFLDFVAIVSTEWENEVRWGWYGGTYPETRAADGKYKIKLYTVLSAHRPNEKEEELPKYDADANNDGQCPDWNALIRTVTARYPDKSNEWAKRAVRQYRYFIDLKVDPKLAKQKLSPSAAIDEIWHTHLSFVERYQHDMVCLTKNATTVVEHLPVHMKQSAKNYEKTHALHSKRMAKLKCLPVDEEFWPTPTEYNPLQYENASDDEKMKGRLVDGKPKYNVVPMWLWMWLNKI